jgi:hypothetical protein
VNFRSWSGSFTPKSRIGGIDALGLTFAAVLREVAYDTIHLCKLDPINQVTAGTLLMNQAGIGQLLKVKRQRCVWQIVFIAELTGRGPGWSRHHKAAKNLQPTRLGEGCERF